MLEYNSMLIKISTSEHDDPGYVALIYVNGETRSSELAIYERINTISSSSTHGGRNTIRKFLSSFEVQGPCGQHTCIVHQAHGVSLDELLGFFPKRAMSLELMKPCLREILIGVGFLHNQVGVAHTGSSAIPFDEQAITA